MGIDSAVKLRFSGTLYHVTARGNGRNSIFLGDADGERAGFLGTLELTSERFNRTCRPYCLMMNSCQLLLETPDANLSNGMRQLNGV